MYLIVYALIFWVLMLVFAIANGVIREKFINPRVGPRKGHIISTLMLSAIISILSYIFVLYWGKEYTIEMMFFVGAGWALATIAFEFSFGHFIAKQPWEKLFEDYNLLEGRIWPLVLVTELLSPTIFFVIFF